MNSSIMNSRKSKYTTFAQSDIKKLPNFKSPPSMMIGVTQYGQNSAKRDRNRFLEKRMTL